MSTIINGTIDAVTFPDGTIQNTSALVAGKTPYANLPAGSVLQVVNATTSTTFSTTSATYVDSGFSASITPKFATSKILIELHLTGCKKDASNSYLQAQIVRNSTALIEFEREGGYTNSSASNSFGGTGTTYVDSPATTSSTTYKIQLHVGGTGTVSFCNSNSVSTITLMEIAQ